MPIIIWGSRGLTSTLDKGRFYCPQCEVECNYTLGQVREWFTIYFIPIFPVGSAQRYVECGRCGTGFSEAVLDVRPPTEGDRMMAEVYHEMEQGESMEEAETRLVRMGVDPKEARAIVDEMGGEDTWTCQTCQQNYLRAVRRVWAWSKLLDFLYT